jgi:aminoglycoside/choline kinase family phosphotransferase
VYDRSCFSARVFVRRSGYVRVCGCGRRARIPTVERTDVERLFALLEEIGEERFLRLLQRALFQRLYGAEYAVRIAAEVAS